MPPTTTSLPSPALAETQRSPPLGQASAARPQLHVSPSSTAAYRRALAGHAAFGYSPAVAGSSGAAFASTSRSPSVTSSNGRSVVSTRSLTSAAPSQRFSAAGSGLPRPLRVRSTADLKAARQIGDSPSPPTRTASRAPALSTVGAASASVTRRAAGSGTGSAAGAVTPGTSSRGNYFEVYGKSGNGTAARAGAGKRPTQLPLAKKSSASSMGSKATGTASPAPASPSRASAGSPSTTMSVSSSSSRTAKSGAPTSTTPPTLRGSRSSSSIRFANSPAAKRPSLIPSLLNSPTSPPTPLGTSRRTSASSGTTVASTTSGGARSGVASTSMTASRLPMPARSSAASDRLARCHDTPPNLKALLASPTISLPGASSPILAEVRPNPDEGRTAAPSARVSGVPQPRISTRTARVGAGLGLAASLGMPSSPEQHTRVILSESSTYDPNPAPLPTPQISPVDAPSTSSPPAAAGSTSYTQTPSKRFEKIKEPILSIDEIIRNHQAGLQSSFSPRRGTSSTSASASASASASGSAAGRTGEAADSAVQMAAGSNAAASSSTVPIRSTTPEAVKPPHPQAVTPKQPGRSGLRRTSVEDRVHESGQAASHSDAVESGAQATEESQLARAALSAKPSMPALFRSRQLQANAAVLKGADEARDRSEKSVAADEESGPTEEVGISDQSSGMRGLESPAQPIGDLKSASATDARVVLASPARTPVDTPLVTVAKHSSPIKPTLPSVDIGEAIGVTLQLSLGSTGKGSQSLDSNAQGRVRARPPSLVLVSPATASAAGMTSSPSFDEDDKDDVVVHRLDDRPKQPSQAPTMDGNQGAAEQSRPTAGLVSDRRRSEDRPMAAADGRATSRTRNISKPSIAPVTTAVAPASAGTQPNPVLQRYQFQHLHAVNSPTQAAFNSIMKDFPSTMLDSSFSNDEPVVLGSRSFAAKTTPTPCHQASFSSSGSASPTSFFIRQDGRYTPSTAASPSEREGSFISAVETLGATSVGAGVSSGRHRSVQSVATASLNGSSAAGASAGPAGAAMARVGSLERRARKVGGGGGGAGSSGIPRAASLRHSRAFSGSSVATRTTTASVLSEADEQFVDAEEGYGRSTVNLRPRLEEDEQQHDTVPVPPLPSQVPFPGAATPSTFSLQPSVRPSGRTAPVSRKISAPTFPSRSIWEADEDAPRLCEEDDEEEEEELEMDDEDDSDGGESVSSTTSIEREVKRTMRATRQADQSRRKAEAMRRRDLKAAKRKEEEDAEMLRFLLRQPSPTSPTGSGGGHGSSGRSNSSIRDMLFPPTDARVMPLSRKTSINKRASIQSVLSQGAGSNSGAGIVSPSRSLSRSNSVRSGTGSISSSPNTPRILQHAASFAGKASPALLKAKASKSSVGSKSYGKPIASLSLVGAWSTPATRSASPADKTMDVSGEADHGGPLPAVPPHSHGAADQQQQALNGSDAASVSKGSIGGTSQSHSVKLSKIPGAGMFARMAGSSATTHGSNGASTNPSAMSSLNLLPRRRAESAASSLSGQSARTAALSFAHTSDGELGSDGYATVSFSKAGLDAGAKAKPAGNGTPSIAVRRGGLARGLGITSPGSGSGPGPNRFGKPGRKSAPSGAAANADDSMVGTLVLPPLPARGAEPSLKSPTVPLTPSNPIAQYLRSERLTRIVTLRQAPFQGLKVSLADVGARGGHPVVIFLGLGAVRYLVGLYDDIASAMGLRLICIDRWGMGKTDDIPEDRRDVLAWGSVVGEVLDQLGVGRFAILAHSGGAPYAMATVLRQTSSRIVGPVHLLAPWVSSQVETNWKWLKYVPDGVIRTAQAAEWRMQAWRLGKQPSLVYEGVGFDARGQNASATSNSGDTSISNGARQSADDNRSQGHSSAHGQRPSKEGSRGSIESVSGTYAAYSRALELNHADLIGSISEEDARLGALSSDTSPSASASPRPSSFGTASGAPGSFECRSAGSAQHGYGATAPESPLLSYANGSGGKGHAAAAAPSLPLSSPTLHPPEVAPTRKLVKKKSSKFGSFFGANTSASADDSSKQALNGTGASASSITRTDSVGSFVSDSRKRTTSLSRLRYDPNREDMTIEVMDDDGGQQARLRRPLRSTSVTSLALAHSRYKDVPPLPHDALARYSVASLPATTSADSVSLSGSLPDTTREGMRRSFSASTDRPLAASSSRESGFGSRSTSTTSLRTVMRIPSASASLMTLDEKGQGSDVPFVVQSTPYLPRSGADLGLGLPLGGSEVTFCESHDTSLTSVPKFVPQPGPSTTTSATSRSASTSQSNTTSQVPDLATALLRASHAESLRGGTADLMAILGRTSRPWGFAYTEVEHPVKVWHGDRDERISLSSAQWMEQEMKNCELIVVKGAGHGLMTNILVVMQALDSIDRHRRD